MRLSVNERNRYDLEDKLDEGNFITFLVACHKLSSFHFITDIQKGWDDIVGICFPNYIIGDFIQIPRLRQGEEWPEPYSNEELLTRFEWIEPSVCFWMGDYRTIDLSTVYFDYAFLSQSHEYTPKESDSLIDIIGQYIRFE